MNKRRNLDSNDWLLLSAYLDDQLFDIEKRQVDERLQTNPDYRQTLDALRHTSMLLRSLPVRRVPRNFTLSAQSSPKKLIPSLIGVLRFSSTAAALLLVTAFALELMQKPTLMLANKTAEDLQPAIAMETAKMPAIEESDSEPPMIIFWGAPAPIMGAYGKGGGGGGAEGSGMGGAGAAPGFYGVGGGGGAPDEGVSEAAPSAEALPAVEATPYAEMAVPESMEGQPPEAELQALDAPAPVTPAPEPLTGSGPILGVRTPEEGAATDAAAEVPLRQPASRAAIPFRLIEILLAVLLVITAIPAWLLKRK